MIPLVWQIVEHTLISTHWSRTGLKAHALHTLLIATLRHCRRLAHPQQQLIIVGGCAAAAASQCRRRTSPQLQLLIVVLRGGVLAASGRRFDGVAPVQQSALGDDAQDLRRVGGHAAIGGVAVVLGNNCDYNQRHNK